ncbi:HsmA family protein [Clostridium akagii]|uniref:HsmA family protein n=1 Tax=Clostridium akagii TaxID=91623 RepID=UPI0004789848|nr:HsmA family protein [Clostridium akagii]
MLVISIILINLALIMYTVVAWKEFRTKSILLQHVIVFSIGFIFDVVGTFLMYKLGGNKISYGIHDVLGFIALFLMLLNLIGSIAVLNKKIPVKFYKFSIFVWIVWIVSYVTGMIVNM